MTKQLAISTPKFGNACLGAVLTVRNTIISVGTNNNTKSHPLAKKFGKNRFSIFPHAELVAIINAQKQGFQDWEKATLYVARVVDKNGFKLALARPCEGCWRAIEHYQIGEVFWSIDGDRIGHYNWYNS